MRRLLPMTTTRLRLAMPLLVLTMLGIPWNSPAEAYPDFQRYLVQSTGRSVNCAMCHVNADGPEGTAPGQIGRLSPAELTQLGQARSALLPENQARSPILNQFGNHILNRLGKTKLLELRLVPGELAGALPAGSDLDHDGISDAEELRAGTHPLLDTDGNPWRLFRHNAWRNRTSLVLTLAATILGLYGLKHLLHGFAMGSGSTGRNGASRENDS